MQIKPEFDPFVAAPNVYKLIFDSERVRVLEATFRPGETAKLHHHPDYVIYALTNGTIALINEKVTDELNFKQGQAVFIKAQDHEAKNIGNTTVDLIIVEFKK